MIGESAQQKKYKVVSLENPIAKVLLHERYSVTSLRAVVVGMFKAFSYKGRSCLKVSILVSRYMLFEQFTSERCPMMYVPVRRKNIMDKMILKDNTTVELQTGASLSAVTAKFDSKDAMLETWKTLTLENLAEVKFQNNAGMTVGTYTDLILESETSQEVSDGVQTTFSFREKTDTEKRLDALEEGQAVQDEAINDLGTATSELAEKEGVE